MGQIKIRRRPFCQQFCGLEPHLLSYCIYKYPGQKNMVKKFISWYIVPLKKRNATKNPPSKPFVRFTIPKLLHRNYVSTKKTLKYFWESHSFLTFDKLVQTATNYLIYTKSTKQYLVQINNKSQSKLQDTFEYLCSFVVVKIKGI